MKITTSNYYDMINKIGIEKLSPAMKKAHELIEKATKGGANWKAYQTYQKAFDLQFQALELLLNVKEKPAVKTEQKQTERKATPKPYAQIKVRPEKPIPIKKQPVNKVKKIEKPKVKGRGVELISPEVAFIRRFALLHNKTKNKEQVVAFIKGLQKAIIEKRIRKTSKHSKIIQEIQRQLVNTYKRMAREVTFKFTEKDLYRYYKMAGSEVMMPSVRFIKAYYNMQGKDITIQKVNILLLRIKKALENKIVSSEDKYYKHIKIIKNSLDEFLDKRGKEALSISEAQLNGLEGVLKSCGCRELNGLEFTEKKNDTSVEKEDGVMTVDEARKAKFRPVELTGDWLRLIGKMCLPTHFLVYGLGGSGKTSFVLLFTQYLASLGYLILYVAREQYNTPTFTELLNRLNISVGDNFKIVKDLVTLNAKDFDFVVLDSKDDMDIQINSFVHLKEQYPAQSFIMISQGTKKGDFTGTGRWRNVVDVMVFAENGIIKTGLDKNRWGGNGEMDLFLSPDSERRASSENLLTLSGIKGKKEKINKNSSSKTSDWTEPKYLPTYDHYRLKQIKKYYDMGEMGMAMDIAMSADTVIREEIPPDVWLAMGGSLTRTGEEKLKKLLKMRNKKSLEGIINEDIIIIETRFEVPIEVLAAVLFTKPMEHRIIDKIYHETEEVEEEVKKQAEDLISEKGIPVKVKEVEFIENDSDDISQGISFYKVILEGKREDLEKVAGINAGFYYEWK